MRYLTTTFLTAVLALPALAAAQDTDEAQSGSQDTAAQSIDAGRLMPLTEWQYTGLYSGGWSAERFIDDMDVYGETGEEIGDVEDLLVDADGNLIAVIAEVGGVWDIGDTHVSVPWDQVTVNQARDGVTVPLSEENVEDYDAFAFSGLRGSKLAEQVTMGMDDVDAGQRAWRLTELIGDYARLQGEGGEALSSNYGYVNDVIIKDGKIAATVVDPASAYGPGYYAYPYFGYGYDDGWEPGDEFYDLPYGEEEIGELGEFDYGELEAGNE